MSFSLHTVIELLFSSIRDIISFHPHSSGFSNFVFIDPSQLIFQFFGSFLVLHQGPLPLCFIGILVLSPIIVKENYCFSLSCKLYCRVDLYSHSVSSRSFWALSNRLLFPFFPQMKQCLRDTQGWMILLAPRLASSVWDNEWQTGWHHVWLTLELDSNTSHPVCQFQNRQNFHNNHHQHKFPSFFLLFSAFNFYLNYFVSILLYSKHKHASYLQKFRCSQPEPPK